MKQVDQIQYRNFNIIVYECEDSEDLKYYLFKVVNLQTDKVAWAPVNHYEKTFTNVMYWIDAGCPPKKKYNFTLKDLKELINEN